MSENVKYTPWDAKIYGIDTYELRDSSEDTLRETLNIPGHFTVKIDPLHTKQSLHQFGFYYCDTLLKPYCKRKEFRPFDAEEITLSADVRLDDLLFLADGIYEHGRFHRDFNLDRAGADNRYNQWLAQLHQEGNVWGIRYNEELAGFAGFHKNHILLQAIKKDYQGQGLGKYFWTAFCRTLFDKGFDEVATSVSACNLPVVNVVTSLGFRFRGAVDVYHKLNT